jgi:hypothetical protein
MHRLYFMAQTKSSEPKSANLSVEQMKAAIPKLNRRISELESFEVNSIQDMDDLTIIALEKKYHSTLDEILGLDTVERKRYTVSFDGNELRWLILSNTSIFTTEIRECYSKGLNNAMNNLRTLKELFEERIEDAVAFPETASPMDKKLCNPGRVFVVHGHDNGAKETVARFLEKLGLKPVILHEQPNQGRTIIEKFEDHADADYAVVLFTPDDMGHPVGKPNESKPRARQNVLLELGFFMAK